MIHSDSDNTAPTLNSAPDATGAADTYNAAEATDHPCSQPAPDCLGISDNHPAPSSDNKTLRAVANTISAIFSPLFVTTFAMLLALFITPLSKAPESARFTSAGVVFALTAILPLATIITLMRMGVVADLAISDRRQRTIPFAVTTACYLGAAGYLNFCHAPSWLCLFFVGAAMAALCALLISLRWKISAHTLGMGGLCGMLIYLSAHHLAGHYSIELIITAVVVSGAVASSRILLGRHTPMQTYAGWLLGVAMATGSMSI